VTRSALKLTSETASTQTPFMITIERRLQLPPLRGWGIVVTLLETETDPAGCQPDAAFTISDLHAVVAAGADADAGCG